MKEFSSLTLLTKFNDKMPLKTIDNLCRICVQESHNYKHIYDQYILDIRLFDIINDLCQLNIYVGDGLPEYICTCCHGKLLEFHKFKQTSHEGKTALLSIKMKIEKMNLETGRQMAAVETIGRSQAQRSLEDDWGNRQLPVESIGQILEVHIKEEPDVLNLEGPHDYSMGEGHKEGSSHQLSEQLTGGSSVDSPSSLLQETRLERKRRLARERKRRFRERHSTDMEWLESQDCLAEGCKPRRTSQLVGNASVEGAETEKAEKDTREISKQLTGGSSVDSPSSPLQETRLERKRRLARERKRRFRERHSTDMAWETSKQLTGGSSVDSPSSPLQETRLERKRRLARERKRRFRERHSTDMAWETSKQDCCAAGADGHVPRRSQALPMEVFVKVGEDCELPLKNDVSSVERDPLCTSEEAIPHTLITLSDDRVFREERFVESSSASARNPIILQRVIKQEVDDDLSETSSLSLADTTAQQESTEAKGEDAVVRGRELRLCTIGGEEDGAVDEHRDGLMGGGETPTPGYRTDGLNCGREGMSSWCGGQIQDDGVSLRFPLKRHCLGNVQCRRMEGDEVRIDGIESGGTALCSEAQKVPSSAGLRLSGPSLCSGDVAVDPCKHMEMESASKESVFQCDVCGGEFETKTSIEEHVQKHVRLDRFDCNVCFMGFVRREDYVRHNLVRHGISVVVGSEPGGVVRHTRIADQVRGFNTDIKTVPPGKPKDKTHICGICSKTFMQKSGLKMHLSIHTGYKPHSCHVCSKSFTRKYFLKKHMSVHTEDRPYTCDICAKSFGTKDILKAHIAFHAGKRPHSCVVCSKAFTTKSNLKTHMIVHTKERAFPCDACSKAFSTRGNLKKHQLLHSRDKPYSCTVCSRAFPHNDQLKTHMSTHTSDLCKPQVE